MNEELLLTYEEMHNVPSKGSYIKWKTDLLKAQLDKACPILEKPLRKKIDKLQKKLVTTNVYYLKELREARKEERERIIKLIEEIDASPESSNWITIIKSSPEWQALKEEK